jgi:L-lactate dehydrogenase complex protein LldG
MSETIREEVMAETAREDILGKLKAAPQKTVPPRPYLPPMKEATLAGEEMVAYLMERLAAEAYTPFRVKDSREALDLLAKIAKEEGLTCVMMSTDDVVAPLGLPAWGREHGVEVMQPGQFEDRQSYKDAIFDRAQASVTGASFVVAETGSLGMAHGTRNPRLLTLAPILHIVLIPVDHVVPVLDAVVGTFFGQKGKYPSQFSFATGPSLTGDITGYLFRGMHGPRRVMAIVIG